MRHSLNVRWLGRCVAVGALSVASLWALGAHAEEQAELQTVPSVDLKRYVGTWYEIARYPTRFQKNCFASTATYTLREDGDIDVLNRCHQDSAQGPVKEVRGKAWVVDEATNAKLKVRFFWPFSGKYWVIDLGKDYEYAVVGEPDREYLWILSRTPALEPAVYQGILERLVKQGYDPKKLIPSRP